MEQYDLALIKMIIDVRCVMCERGAGGDVEHILMTCGELERVKWALADEVNRIIGATA